MTATASETLARLADGYLSTQLLFVATALKVPDVLAAGPRSADDIAAELGVAAGPLRRVLRGLAADAVLDDLPGDRFALTPVGSLLLDGVPGSMRGAVLIRGRLYYDALGRLLDGVCGGATPFELVYGEPFFEHLAARPAANAAFRASMADRSAREAAAVVAAYDFGRFRRLIDVGGGPGILLRAVLHAAPGIAGVLFDRPEVIAHSSLPAVGGDFFADVPGGADAYLLSRVIHDWDDTDAVTVLGTCRRAMSPGATLLLVEAVLPRSAADDPAAVRMDLHMLALLHGRERTEAEYAALLAEAGLTLVRTVPTTAGVHVLEACRDDEPPRL